ncbi:cytochrome c [Lutibacter sp. HS1-25]|uniref:c-type cytochrome n=1 Tax=Lutibacter sp. HS1-25 TaxID=2485000 RepID=UPI001011ED23|nr:cytochrome c [Lutibacter sp. HS1-25]RXP44514.1 cytochrome c [Lutibacter sp. HS1-25]
MKLKILVLAAVVAFLSSCSGSEKKSESNSEAKEEVKVEVEVDPMQNKGIGPITSITLGEIDDTLAAEGKTLFSSKCSACHKISKRVVGPALIGITERRSPEWIMNMMLNPEVMVTEDPIAKKLLAEYLAPMANQSLTEVEARAILEYFRTKTSSNTEE